MLSFPGKMPIGNSVISCSVMTLGTGVPDMMPGGSRSWKWGEFCHADHQSSLWGIFFEISSFPVANHKFWAILIKFLKMSAAIKLSGLEYTILGQYHLQPVVKE